MHSGLFFISFFCCIHNALTLNIHVFGDSHSCEFSQTAFHNHFGKVPAKDNEIPICQIHYMGPVTMNRIGRDGISALNLKDYGVDENDIVIFAFGEIDVRCHINRIADLQEQPVGVIINTLATEYVQTIVQNRSCYNNLICMIYSVTPPSDIAFNPQFPFYGSIATRVITSRSLNKRLSQLCSEFDLNFIDVYDKYSLPDGSLDPNLGDGNVHLNPIYNKVIWEEIEDLLKSKYRAHSAISELFQNFCT